MSAPRDPQDDHHEHLPRGHRKAYSGSTRLYRRLLWFYPEEFREEYAQEMECYFGELCEDSLRRGGLVALLVTNPVRPPAKRESREGAVLAGW